MESGGKRENTETDLLRHTSSFTLSESLTSLVFNHYSEHAAGTLPTKNIRTFL